MYGEDRTYFQINEQIKTIKRRIVPCIIGVNQGYLIMFYSSPLTPKHSGIIIVTIIITLTITITIIITITVGDIVL